MTAPDGGTTAWAHGFGGWWRRERGATLRVHTRSLPPRDGDAVWLAEVRPPPGEAERAPTMLLSHGVTADAARAWCDRWADALLRELAAGPA